MGAIRSTEALTKCVYGDDSKVVGRGMCARHWQRWKVEGKPPEAVLSSQRPPWRVHEDAQLIGLLQDTGTALLRGRARYGEVGELADRLGRPYRGVVSRLYRLRKGTATLARA